jgi:polysaccharide biosynthesis transport protein
VLGVVLNNVDVRSDSQYQYYTSYYTYYAPTDMDRDKTSANAVETPIRPSSTVKKSKEVGASGSDDIY